MSPKYLIRLAVIVAAAIIIFSSCNLRQKYVRPQVKTDSLYRGANNKDTTGIANISWKQMFTDQKLQDLLQEGITNSYDLKIAVTRIKQAEANLRQSKAAYLPTLSVEPQYTKERTSYAEGGSFGIFPNNLYELSASASWEIDLWGKLKGAQKAALAS